MLTPVNSSYRAPTFHLMQKKSRPDRLGRGLCGSSSGCLCGVRVECSMFAAAFLLSFEAKKKTAREELPVLSLQRAVFHSESRRADAAG